MARRHAELVLHPHNRQTHARALVDQPLCDLDDVLWVAAHDAAAHRVQNLGGQRVVGRRAPLALLLCMVRQNLLKHTLLGLDRTREDARPRRCSFRQARTHLAEREAGDLSLELVVQQSRPPSEKLDEGFFVGEDTRLCDVACIHAQRGCTSGVAARHALERRLQVPKALRQQHSTAARGCSSSVAARHALQRRLQVPKALENARGVRLLMGWPYVPES
mmetsp:Transcript_45750/g.107391  ORF Transcript_45750/g.107391 Transcript_45750/m.107391 type:complete len:219 (-) Transcript_45750:178-834(-)